MSLTVHPDDQIHPARVTAPAATTTGTVTQRSYAALAHARNTFQRHIEKVNAERHLYTAAGYTAQLAAFKDTEAARAVLHSVSDMRARRDKAQADVDKVRASLSSAGDAAQESRNSRYWARTKGVLDAADTKATSTASQLIANASREELGVLLEELPSYFTARGSESEWIEPTIAQVVPEYGAAKEQLTKASAAAQFIESAARAIQKGFDTGSVPSAQLIDQLNPSTAGRLAIDRSGTLPDTNGGKYDPDL
jgi:hypothetical protein